MSRRDGDGSSVRPERDPVADLVSRSVGAHVESVDVEVLLAESGIERKRLRFSTMAGATSAIFERRPRGQILEAQLLPFLARKTDRVPVVHSRGLPPPAASLGPWLLLEDVYAGDDACAGEVREIVRAKLAIERAVTNDLPALRALGVREDNRAPALEGAAGRGLLHGALVCANARRVARGIVLVDWSRASLGPTVLDIAELARDLERQGKRTDADAVREVYITESGALDAPSLLFAAARTLEGGENISKSGEEPLN